MCFRPLIASPAFFSNNDIPDKNGTCAWDFESGRLLAPPHRPALVPRPFWLVINLINSSSLRQCKLLYMDHLQRQPCRKNLNNNEDQNILWNEKCGKVFSPPELNEFEKLLVWLDGAADNSYLDTRDDVGDGGPEPQQY
ncbi:hypothetical protein AVEN_44558-1 [Araneus ventricosus]|uniref:Uncharacterized protein n=1 Tax=Araneus ventricosus TaxID=182803 RepID=A0A4Y2MTK5_ARAVE|nr:hypothetical protein AVEN_44558-1 [Araneus ventricosus]